MTVVDTGGTGNSYRIEIDWAPAYELTASLTGYLRPQLHKTLDLGPQWAERVGRECPGLADRMRSIVASIGPDELADPVQLVWRCPGARDVDGLIRHLEGLSVGGLYELVAPQLLDIPHGIPADLGKARDRTVELLRAWNDGYFAHVDGDILERLQAAAEVVRGRMSSFATPEDLIEEVTGGIRLENATDLRTVVLVPQYHFCPLNILSPHRGGMILLYQADVRPGAADEPPMRLERVTRALGDRTRLRILRFVANSGGATFTDVARFTGLAKSTVHHHLLVLRAAGLVRVHTDARGRSTPTGDRYTFRAAALDGLKQGLAAYVGGERA